MITVYSFIPCLYDEVGHHYSYHLSLSEIFKRNDWQDIKFIPRECNIKNLSGNWEKKLILYQGGSKKSVWKNFLKPFFNLYPFLKILLKIKKDKINTKIFFFEYFSIIHLLAFYLALIFSRPKNSKLWILYRTDLDQIIFKGKFHKFLHVLILKILHDKNICFFTDSDLLKVQLEDFFEKKFNVLPIPHSKIDLKKNPRIIKDNIICWWPGGSIREEKGFENIKKLVEYLSISEKMIITIADAAKNLFSNPCVKFIPTNLTRKDYEKQMVSSDLILLPYISELYRFRTSGIFVESIVSGSIPVVSKDTWMAYELKKFELEKLIIDWDSKTIVNDLKSILEDTSIYEKIKFMQKSYQKFHSLENFAFLMKELVNQK